MHNSQKQSALLIEEKELQYVALDKGGRPDCPLEFATVIRTPIALINLGLSRQAKPQLASTRSGTPS